MEKFKVKLEEVELLLEIAHDAGKAIMEIYKSGDFETIFKDDEINSPLTAADMAAHNIIVASLRNYTPGVPVLTEESEQMEFKDRAGYDQFWLVDPLDGTKEFIKKNDEFTVNIALIEKGKPVFGVVYAPALEVTYYGVVGGAAFKAKNYSGSGKVTADKINVRAYNKGGPRAVASKSHRGENIDKFFEKIGNVECMSKGSSLKLCLVAEGVADIYPRFGPTMEWDTAAAHAVVIAAGGQVTDLSGNDLKYNKRDLHNPFFMVTGKPPFPWQKYIDEVKMEEKG